MVYVLTKCLLLFIFFFMASSVGLKVLRLLKVQDRGGGETFILSAAMGFAAICESIIFLGLFGLFKPLYLIILFLSLFAASAKEARFFLQKIIYSFKLLRNIRHKKLLFAFAIFILINIFKCLLPPHGPTDVLHYHMTLPKLYFAYGSIVSMPTFFRSYFPANVEILYSLGLIIGGPVFVNLTHFGFTLLTVIALYIYFRKYFGNELAILPGIIYLTAPVVNSWGTMAYVSNFLGFYLFILFILLWEWNEEADNKMHIVLGLITGMIMGMKYTGVFYAGTIYLFCVFHLVKKSRRFIPLVCIALGTGIIFASPWYMRNIYNTGNPFFPLLSDLFPSDMIRCCGHFSSELRWVDIFFYKLIKNVRSFLRSMSFFYFYAFNDSDYNRFIGPVFLAFLPFSFFTKRNPMKRALVSLLFIFSSVIVLLSKGSFRHTPILIIILSLLCSTGIREIYLNGKAKMRGFIIIFFCFIIFIYSFHNYHTMLRHGRILTAFNPNLIPSFLKTFERSFAPAEFANSNLPPGSRLLFLGSFPWFYYFNFEPFNDHEEQTVIIYDGAQTAEDILGILKSHSVTHIIRTEDINPRSMREIEFVKDPRFIKLTEKYLAKIYSGNKISIYAIQYPIHFSVS